MNKRIIKKGSIEEWFYNILFIVVFIVFIILSWIWYFISPLFSNKIILGREFNGEWLKSLPVGTYIYLGIIER